MSYRPLFVDISELEEKLNEILDLKYALPQLVDDFQKKCDVALDNFSQQLKASYAPLILQYEKSIEQYKTDLYNLELKIRRYKSLVTSLKKKLEAKNEN